MIHRVHMADRAELKRSVVYCVCGGESAVVGGDQNW